MNRAETEARVLDFVRGAYADHRAFEIVAGGTRRAAGRPTNLPLFDVSGLAGIVHYQPEELILTVRPGTSLTEINRVLADKNQCLGFDPVDWSFLGQAGTATIGGALSADASGSGRLRHGAARDSLLGFRAVNGLGEAFNAGGKVVKNVTGFDLPKLVCGAFGTLCVLTELTFRVFPKPRCSSTVALTNVAPEEGFAALRKIWHSALEPSGLAYLPGGSGLLADTGKGAALIRFEAAEKPLAEKCVAASLLVGQTTPIAQGDALFATIGSGAVFANSGSDVWKVFLPPSEAARVALAAAAPLWLGDWAGSVLWLGLPGAEGPRLRALAAEAGGHAQLLRASPEHRAKLGMFAPKPAALEAISARVRAAFDPLSLFNPGRL
jgi:glycolate oxidase FAD binding subunit